MRPVLKELLRPENYPAYGSVILAGLGVVGGLSNYQIPVILAILALVSVNIVTERVVYFRKISDAIESRRQSAVLRSRDDPDFQHFHQFIEGGQEIFVAALSLGFICQYRENDLHIGMKQGVDYKFLIVDPKLSDDAMEMIAEHDERRSMNKAQALRSEIETSVEVLRNVKNHAGGKGTITLKAGKGLPVFTVTMVNPRQPNGKMRVELRPYHRNLGPRPYLELRRTNPEDARWYEQMFEHYYVRLWDDSHEIQL
jgi:hypothetical protein